jgi:hypothetical protein
MTRRERLFASAAALNAAGEKSFEPTCARDQRYLELDSGAPFIPIGMNVSFERYATDKAELLARMDRRFLELAAKVEMR